MLAVRRSFVALRMTSAVILNEVKNLQAEEKDGKWLGESKRCYENSFVFVVRRSFVALRMTSAVILNEVKNLQTE